MNDLFEKLISQLSHDKEAQGRLAAAKSLDALGWIPKNNTVGAAYWAAKQDWGKCRQMGSIAIPALVALLTDEEVRVRKAAMQVLGQLGDLRALEPLIKGLWDKHSEVCSEAARALGKLADKQAVEPLLTILQAEYVDRSISEAAVLASGELGDLRAVEPMIAMLNHWWSSEQLRQHLARTLGKLGDARAIEPLSALLREKNDDLYEAATSALAQLGEPGIKRLLAELKDWKLEPKKKKAIAKALAKWGDLRVLKPLIDLLGDQSWQVREAAAQALGNFGHQQAVEPLTALLENENRQVRQAARRALRELDDDRQEEAQTDDKQAVERLIPQLKHRDSEVRQRTAQALGWPGHMDAVAALISALADRQVKVRRAALHALGEIGHTGSLELMGTLVDALLGTSGEPPVLESLIARLSQQDEKSRMSAAWALGEIGDLAAVEPLIVTLEDWNQRVRFSAAWALGQLNDLRAVSPLIASLKDWNRLVRATAAHGLARLGDQQAIEALIPLLTDETFYVRQVVAQALEALGWQPKDNVIGAAYWVAKQDWAQCIGVGSDAVKPLLLALADKDSQVRQGAARALGQVADVRAVEPLIPLLNNKKSELRQTAARALGQLGDQQAVTPLIALLRDRNNRVRGATGRALGQLGDARAIKPLLATLKDWESEVRQAAVEALGELRYLRTLKPLISTLRDETSQVRQSAAQVLGQSGDLRAVKPLINALFDEASHVRQAAVRALERLDDVRAIEPLIGTLTDENGQVREAAASALNALLKSATLGAFVWSMHRGQTSPDAWPVVGGILNNFAEREFIGTIDGGATQLTRLIHHVATRQLKRQGFQEAQTVYVETLRYYQTKLDAWPLDSDDSLIEVARFCFELSYTATQSLLALGHLQIAKEIIQQSLNLAALLGNASLAWHELNRLCLLLLKSQHDALALDVYNQVVALIQRSWFMQPIGDEEEEEGLRHFFADKAQIFDGLALCRLRLGAYAQAWESLEAAKTRYLGDLIARRQRPPQRRYERANEQFWGIIRRARTTARGRDADAPLAMQEVVGIERSATGLSDAIVVPRHKQALEEYLGGKESDLSPLVEQLWQIAASLSGHPLAASVREALAMIHQVVSGLLESHRDEWATVSTATRREALELARTRLVELAQFDGNHSLGLWWFDEFPERLTWDALIAGQEPNPRQSDLELEALLEVLNFITGQGAVIVSTRPRTETEEEAEEPRLIFRTDTQSHNSRRSHRFDQAQAELTDAWARLSRTKWRYLFRVARGEIVSFTQMRSALAEQPHTALVEFHLTSEGTIVYLSRSRQNSSFPSLLPSQPDETALSVITQANFTLAHMQQLMKENWLTPYQAYLKKPSDQEAKQKWKRAIEETLAQIYDQLLRPIDSQLQRWGVKRLIFVPHRALHLLPLHACCREIKGQRRHLLDDYEITYSPSSTLREICRERATTRQSQNTLTAISNPTDDLPFATYEVEQIAKHFTNHQPQLLSGKEAQREAVTALTAGSILHFSGHGKYQWDNPLDSRLLLAGATHLTLGDLFCEDIPLPDTYLTTLSACETNITDPEDLADEYLGIASGFLFAGAPSVISTLWAINDLASALLIERFYHHHRQEALTPAASLRKAQRWLRDVTAGELEKEFAKKRRQRGATRKQASTAWRRFAVMESDTQPFAHPYYWAAFTFTGV